MQDLMHRLRDRPFYIWGPVKHKRQLDIVIIVVLTILSGYLKRTEYLTILELLGYNLPHRNKRKTISSYIQVKHVWIKKATGLGITEFCLRFMAWLCPHNNDYKNSQTVIVTGLNKELAKKGMIRITGYEIRLNKDDFYIKRSQREYIKDWNL